jgi:transposase-like protein
MMFERGVAVSHEAIRLWTLKFGAAYARRLRRCAGRHGDTWHLDEVFCKINGELVYLWRAVDQEGDTLEVLVQKRRNAKAARRFLRRLLKRLGYAPRAIVTDKLSSYAAARSATMPAVEHRRGGRLNNRAENSHQPSRAGATNAALQVDSSRTAISLCPRINSESLPPASTSAACLSLPGDHGQAFKGRRRVTGTIAEVTQAM